MIAATQPMSTNQLSLTRLNQPPRQPLSTNHRWEQVKDLTDRILDTQPSHWSAHVGTRGGANFRGWVRSINMAIQIDTVDQVINAQQVN